MRLRETSSLWIFRIKVKSKVAREACAIIDSTLIRGIRSDEFSTISSIAAELELDLHPSVECSSSGKGGLLPNPAVFTATVGAGDEEEIRLNKEREGDESLEEKEKEFTKPKSSSVKCRSSTSRRTS